MKSGAGSWVLGTGASVALHAAGAAVALALVAPEDMPEQATPGAQFELETTALDRSRAEEQPAEGEAAEDVAPESEVAQGQSIVRREATSTAPTGTVAAPVEQTGQAAAPVAPSGNVAMAETPDAPATQSSTPEGASAEPRPLDAARAEAAAPESERAEARLPEASRSEAQLPQSTKAEAQIPDTAVARAEAPDAPTMQAQLPQAPTASAITSSAPAAPAQILSTAAAAPAALSAPSVSAAGIDAPVQAAFVPPERRAEASAPEGARAEVQATAGTQARPAEVLGDAAVAAPAEGALAAAAPAEGAEAPAAEATGAQAPTVSSEGTPAPSAEAPSKQAAAAVVEGPVISADLAWAGEGALDPQGLAAVQAFLPEDARSKEGEDVRDDISSLMSSVPCARVHTAFNPDTGALEVRGHVPTAEARPELVGALRSRVGETLPVTDALRLLPEPQCGVLTGIESLGLPPSEEQFTDPALVGETGWAQDYAFRGGEALELNLQGADYPSYVYLDYYDGAGNVVHVVPNDFIALPFLGPEEPFYVGPSEGFEIYFSPPYGQDIVVALAAEAPLYEGLRPTVESAEEYLTFLRERLDEMGEMRGEWAYFFVTTSAP